MWLEVSGNTKLVSTDGVGVGIGVGVGLGVGTGLTVNVAEMLCITLAFPPEIVKEKVPVVAVDSVKRSCCHWC